MGFFSKLGITGSSNKDEAQIYCGSIYNINPEYTYKEGEHTQDDIRGKFVERIMFRLLNDDPKHVVEIITGKKIPLVFDNYNKNPNVSTFMYLGKESTPRTIAYQTTPTKAYDPYKLAEYTERNWAFIPAYVDNVLTYLAEHPDVELYKEFLDLHLEKGELYAKGCEIIDFFSC